MGAVGVLRLSFTMCLIGSKGRNIGSSMCAELCSLLSICYLFNLKDYQRYVCRKFQFGSEIFFFFELMPCTLEALTVIKSLGRK